jgi:hypothetical protein
MVAIAGSTVYYRFLDDYESTQSMGTSKERFRLMIDIQPKDTSKGHFYVSLVKSIIRIGAGGCLIQGNLVAAGGLLILAEMLGIVEELV